MHKERKPRDDNKAYVMDYLKDTKDTNMAPGMYITKDRCHDNIVKPLTVVITITQWVTFCFFCNEHFWCQG